MIYLLLFVQILSVVIYFSIVLRATNYKIWVGFSLLTTINALGLIISIGKL